MVSLREWFMDMYNAIVYGQFRAVFPLWEFFFEEKIFASSLVVRTSEILTFSIEGLLPSSDSQEEIFSWSENSKENQEYDNLNVQTLSSVGCAYSAHLSICVGREITWSPAQFITTSGDNKQASCLGTMFLLSMVVFWIMMLSTLQTALQPEILSSQQDLRIRYNRCLHTNLFIDIHFDFSITLWFFLWKTEEKTLPNNPKDWNESIKI